MFPIRQKNGKSEVLLKTASGSTLPAYLSFNLLNFDQASKTISLLVTDLTAQKRLERIVAEGELIQEILRQGEQAIAICDRSGVIIRASWGLHELCGQNPLLLPFHHVFPLKTPDNKTFLLSPLFQGTSLRNLEADFRRPDGKKIHVLLNAGPVRARDGEINGFVATLTDISERLQAEAEREKLLERLQLHEEELQVVNEELRVTNEELQVHMEELQVQAEELRVANQKILAANEALRDSEDKYRSLFETMAEGVNVHELIYDNHGRPVDYRILYSNPAVEKHTGVRIADIQGKLGSQADGMAEVPYLDVFARVAQTGEPISFETFFPPLSRYYHVSVTSHKKDQFVTVFEDITEHRQMEAAVHLSHQRLDLLAASAGRLLASADPQEVVADICLKVMQFLDCEVFFNCLRDKSAGRLHLNAWAGIPAEEAARIEWLDYGVAVCGCAAPEGCRIVADDILHYPGPPHGAGGNPTASRPMPVSRCSPGEAVGHPVLRHPQKEAF